MENEKELIKKEKILSKKIKIILIILILILAIFLGYISRNKIDSCENEKCFFDSLKDCKEVKFIREDLEYSWLYFISKEVSKDLCEVNVELLEVKEGSINPKLIENKGMVCIVPKTIGDFPENEISRCSGVLKERLQDLIIKRMYDYLLVNVQEINTSFFEPL